jgi:hypothetical protein
MPSVNSRAQSRGRVNPTVTSNPVPPLFAKPKDSTMAATSAQRGAQFLFVALSLLGLLGFALSPQARSLVSVMDHGRWFLDSYAVLASSDAQRLGIDPNAPNPLDLFQRSHKYSDWWFVLGDLGLTRKDNFLVGGVWVLGFLVAVFTTVKATSRGAAVWLALLVSSPPVLLGVIRANNDLVVFVLLALALWSARSDSGWRCALTVALVSLATGLKFYPAVAGSVFLLVRSPRRRTFVLLAAAVAIGATLGMVRGQIARGAFHLEPEIYTLGGRILLLDLGFPERAAALGSVIILGAASLIAARWIAENGLAAVSEKDEAGLSRALTLGGALLLGCFAAGMNHGYRWIFVLWVAPWLWENRARHRILRVAAWLLPVCLWHYALLCVATVLWFPNLTQEQYDGILVGWRYATEPLTWFLMILIGGWLIDLARIRVGEMRAAFATGR